MAAILVDERDRDQALVAVPRAEVQIVARIGPMADGGLDLHAIGPQHEVRRKLIRAGQRTVAARLPFGACEAMLGVSASALALRPPIPLAMLWGEPATRRLLDRLAAAPTSRAAGAILAHALAERGEPHHVHARLASAAADRLATSPVSSVAASLGVSERNLRRVFRDVVGVSPKLYARLTRFQRALHAARTGRPVSWASIAVACGYYDQSHLIDEFRAIAGVTPSALLLEASARTT